MHRHAGSCGRTPVVNSHLYSCIDFTEPRVSPTAGAGRCGGLEAVSLQLAADRDGARNLRPLSFADGFPNSSARLPDRAGGRLFLWRLWLSQRALISRQATDFLNVNGLWANDSADLGSHLSDLYRGHGRSSASGRAAVGDRSG